MIMFAKWVVVDWPCEAYRIIANPTIKLNTITWNSRLTPPKLYKNPDATFSMYVRNGIVPVLSLACSLVSIAKVNIAKSNKSELWNCLSYRGLPYLFEVWIQIFIVGWNFLKKLDQNSTSNVIWPQLKRPNWEFKKNVIGQSRFSLRC
jgi:hypothetical protein